ncbi:5109_t:CDS:2, partial [Gigaspora margarita]
IGIYSSSLAYSTIRNLPVARTTFPSSNHGRLNSSGNHDYKILLKEFFGAIILSSIVFA